jgi:hypothetical protein
VTARSTARRAATTRAHIKVVENDGPDLSELMALAGAVRDAQERKNDAYREVMRAQNALRLATDDLAQAEADFQHAAPTAFGLGSPVERGDALSEWLRARCVIGGRHETKSSALFDDFRLWMADTGLFNPDQWTLIRFGFAMTERGFGVKKLSGGIKHRTGIGLRNLDQADG